MSIKCGHCKNTHTSVEQVRLCSAVQIGTFVEDVTTAHFIPTPPVLAQLIVDAATKPAPVTEIGLYKKPNGVVFRVKVGKTSGHLYAERLVKADKYNQTFAQFEYAPGALKELTADMRMTLAEVEEYNLDIVNCCICGRVLTKKSSKDAKIGPICASKY